MGLIEEIKECFSEAGITAAPVFRAALFGFGALYIEGARSIKSYSEKRVEIRLKKGGLVVVGENLYIKKYCAGDLAICGDVSSVEKV